MTLEDLKEYIESNNKIYWRAISTDKLISDYYLEDDGSLEQSLKRLDFLFLNNSDKKFTVIIKSKKNEQDANSPRFIVTGEAYTPGGNQSNNQFNGLGGLGALGGFSIQGLLTGITETMQAKTNYELEKQALALQGLESKYKFERQEERLKEREDKIREKELELKEKEKELEKAIEKAEKAIESRSAPMMFALEKTLEGFFGLKTPVPSAPIEGPQQAQSEQMQIIEQICEHLMQREKDLSPNVFRLIFTMINKLDHVDFEKIDPREIMIKYSQVIDSLK